MEKNKYIYESPDGGKTLFRRLFGKTDKEFVGNKSSLPINNQKIAIVLGAGGFIGSHLVKRLKEGKDFLESHMEAEKEFLNESIEEKK